MAFSLFKKIVFTILGFLGGSKVNANMNLNNQELPIILEPGPVILGTTAVVQRDASACLASYVAECFDQLITFNELGNLRFVKTEDDLDHFCSVAELGHNCTRSLYDQNKCLSADEHALFPHYESLANNIHNILCIQNNKSPFEKDLLKDSPCFMKNKGDIDQCFHESQLPQIPMLTILDNGTESLAEKAHKICCSLERYISCSRQKISTDCGSKEGDTFALYIQYAAGSDVLTFCQKEGFPNYPNKMDEVCKSGAIRNTGFAFWIILLFIPWCMMYHIVSNLLV